LILHPFEYHAPETLEEAVDLAEKYGEDSKFLAGGQSLIPLMKLGLFASGHVIDLGRVRGLDHIRKEDGVLAIGGLAKMADIGGSRVVEQACPALTDCAVSIADPLVRNMGTIGGNVCHADPANDVPAVAVASGAEMVLVGRQGERRMKAQQFFLDTFTTAAGRGEVLKEIRFDAERCRGSAYIKLQLQATDFAIVGAAARLWVQDGAVGECGIGLTGVGPTVLHPKKAEGAVQGSRLGTDAFSRAAELAAAEARPVSDLRGTAEYKQEMAKVVTRRALENALKRAGGGRR
jgi:carbon-monoxide dehydrogenase medium subunit